MLTINRIVIVDIGITERATGSDITANTNADDRADRVENFEQLRFGDTRGKVTNIKRGARNSLLRSGDDRSSLCNSGRRHFAQKRC